MTSIRDWCPKCDETGWACRCGKVEAPPMTQHPDQAELKDSIALGVSEQVSTYLHDMLEDMSSGDWEELTVKLYEIAADVAAAALNEQQEG